MRIKIGEIKDINIIVGQIFGRVEAKKNEEKLGEIKVLLPKAISNGYIDDEALEVMPTKVVIDPTDKKLTSVGDIIMKLSSPNEACVIEEGYEGLLVPSFCAIINNLPENIDKYYFAAFLSSESFTNKIKASLTGVTIPLLSIGQLKKLEIIIPDEDTQVKIGEEFRKNSEKIKLVKQIVRLEKEKINSIFYEMEDKNEE